jgi:hypothetical protein
LGVALTTCLSASSLLYRAAKAAAQDAADRTKSAAQGAADRAGGALAQARDAVAGAVQTAEDKAKWAVQHTKGKAPGSERFVQATSWVQAAGLVGCLLYVVHPAGRRH